MIMGQNFENVKKEGRLLYQYVRGSQLYNTQMDNGTSDIDTGGIFIAPLEDSIGTHIHYQDEIASAKHDDVIYELEKYGRMLGTSNSTVLESLFVPEDKMIVKPHKCLDAFFAHKNDFITQECFKPFTAYAISQIKKCSGLNKAINNVVNERLTPLDFCYTFKDQGSTKIKNWLAYRNLKQEYCGLVAVPNMTNVYGVYYDWGTQFENESISFEQLAVLYYSTPASTKDIVDEMKKMDANIPMLQKKLEVAYLRNMVHFIKNVYHLDNEDKLRAWYEENRVPTHYRGMTVDLSTDLRLSSVKKGEAPICQVVYNELGYTKHCVDYKNYKEWEKNRNPARYESNLNKKYDSKNMYHCFRLIQMGIEIANGEGVNLARTYDKEFLLNIRQHKYEYEEIMEMALAKQKEMEEAMKNTSLPRHLDRELINSLVIDAKKSFFKLY